MEPNDPLEVFSTPKEIKCVQDGLKDSYQQKVDDVQQFKVRAMGLQLEAALEHLGFLLDTEDPDSETIKARTEFQKIYSEIEATYEHEKSKINGFSIPDIDNLIDKKLQEIQKNYANYELYKDTNPAFLRYRAITEHYKTLRSALKETFIKMKEADKEFGEKSINRYVELNEVVEHLKDLMLQETSEERKELLKVKELILEMDILENYKQVHKLLISNLDLRAEIAQLDVMANTYYLTKPSQSPEDMAYTDMFADFMAEVDGESEAQIGRN